MYQANTIISVPVNSNNSSDFVHREPTDPYHQLIVTEKVYNFLEKNLKKLSCDIPEDFELELSELIYNCYDAYAKNKLFIGNELKISIDVIEDEDKVIVNIQDNGCGFKSSSLGKQFTLEDIKPDMKAREHFAGGEKKGLIDFRNMLQLKNIGLFFSNSLPPNLGAVVTMEFPKQQRPLISDCYILF